MDNNTVKTTISMGLDAIFSAHHPILKNENNHKKIPLSVIKPSPFQARKHFSEKSLAELAESIKQHGLLQPLIVRRKTQEEYELIAGERRLRAMQLIQMPEAPIIECDIDDVSAMAFGLIENIQRQNLNVIEEADAYHRLLFEFQLSHELLAERVGKSRSHISNVMRLNRLASSIKQRLIDDEMSMGHARAILSLPENQQIKLVERIVQDGLSVRQTELLVRKLLNTMNSSEQLQPTIFQSDFVKNSVNYWKKQLQEKFAAQIKINLNQDGSAKVMMQVNSENELMELMEQLVK
ncbi:MAG: hypothetical protein A3C44_04505 [Gammaproteobacteria bacterium RIFCSPHIGHO2_02_FULL_39_13]|nr:MAG: hypothetical protein A3C44_04505 [Gammaproteobacteria bacterium RIFCSPHIGHO2_02_FULL_39_13]